MRLQSCDPVAARRETHDAEGPPCEVVYGGEGGGRTRIPAPFYIVGVSSGRTAGITQPTAHLSHPPEESNLCGPRTAVVLPHQLEIKEPDRQGIEPQITRARRTLYTRIRCSPSRDRKPNTRSGCTCRAALFSQRFSAVFPCMQGAPRRGRRAPFDPCGCTEELV